VQIWHCGEITRIRQEQSRKVVIFISAIVFVSSKASGTMGVNATGHSVPNPRAARRGLIQKILRPASGTIVKKKSLRPQAASMAILASDSLPKYSPNLLSNTGEKSLTVAERRDMELQQQALQTQGWQRGCRKSIYRDNCTAHDM
jgi:hypothetical protein